MGKFSDKFSSIFFLWLCSSFLIYVRARQMVVLFLNKKWIFFAFDAQNLGLCYKPGNPFWGGRLSTNVLLVKVACFLKEVSHIFNIKSSWFKLVSSRRSTVLSLPFIKGSLTYAKKSFTTVHGQLWQAGQNMGRVFNSTSGCMFGLHLLGRKIMTICLSGNA
jgi:hypothetical protein